MTEEIQLNLGHVERLLGRSLSSEELAPATKSDQLSPAQLNVCKYLYDNVFGLLGYYLMAVGFTPGSDIRDAFDIVGTL